MGLFVIYCVEVRFSVQGDVFFSEIDKSPGSVEMLLLIRLSLI